MKQMAEKRDYYEILGISRSANEKEISEAYRKLALKYHPDRNPDDDGASTKFKEAAEAFEVLSHAEKRARYDRFGHAGLEGAGAAPHFDDISDIFDAFGGIFGDMFGAGAGRRRRRRRGADIQCEVTLDLMEAARGTSKTIEFERHETCQRCQGRGGDRLEACSYCGGHGIVVQSSGIFSMRTTCPSCRGEGKVVRDPCGECRGLGFVPHRVTRTVEIPPGVDNDIQLRLNGEGEPSPDGGPRGDCYCMIHVKPHPLFQRKGRHLVCEVPISYSQAALGSRIEVPTLDGNDELEIPAGTPSGKIFHLRGKGMPDPRHRKPGDLLVQVTIEVPKKLTREHREILERLAQFESVNISPERHSFVDKLKHYFGS